MIAKALIAFAFVAAVTTMVAGIYFEGKRAGKADCAERAAVIREAAQAAADSAASAAATAISKIKVQNRTIMNEVQREVQTNTVYRDCRHSDEQLRRINAALTGERAEPAGSGILPSAGAASGLQLRSNDAEAD